MPRWMYYPLLLASLGSAFALFRRGDLVTAAMVVLVSGSAVTGFRVGLARMAASALGLFAAILYAPSLGIRYEHQFSVQLGTSGLTNRFLCIATFGLLISLLVSIAATFVINRTLLKRRMLTWLNAFAGFTCGAIEGAAVAWLVLGGLLTLQLWQRDDNIENNTFAIAIDDWASKTRQSLVGPIVRDYNPFDRIEFLSRAGDANQAMRILGDPKNIQRILDDPRLKQLRNDPAVAAAIEEVLSDRTMKQWMEQQHPLDKELLLQLMSNPAVLALTDHPEFIEQARQVLADLK